MEKIDNNKVQILYLGGLLDRYQITKSNIVDDKYMEKSKKEGTWGEETEKVLK